MRFDKLTAKFQQALQEGQSLALAADSSYLEAGFILKALLDDQNSGAAALLAHAGVNVPQVKQRLQQHLSSLPKVSGQGGDIMPSRELQAVLNLMDKAATKRGDAYIASELFLLALVQQNDATGKILKEAGATEQNNGLRSSSCGRPRSFARRGVGNAVKFRRRSSGDCD